MNPFFEEEEEKDDDDDDDERGKEAGGKKWESFRQRSRTRRKFEYCFHLVSSLGSRVRERDARRASVFSF